MSEGVSASEATVALAKSVIRLPFIGEEFDVEAFSAAAKAALKGKDSLDVNKEEFKAVFVELGVETEIVPPEPEQPESKGGEDGESEGEEEGEEEKEGEEEGEEEEREPTPEVPKEYTFVSEALWNLFDKDNVGSVCLPQVVASLALFKGGYGPDALRAALAAYDVADGGDADEGAVWAAVQLAAPKPLTGQQLTHIRRAWRAAEKTGQGEEEEEEVEEEEGEGESKGGGEEDGPPPPPRVIIDSFMDCVSGDEYLATVLCEPVPIPLEDPETSDVPDDEDDE